MKTLAIFFIASFCFLSMTSLKTENANKAESAIMDKTNYAELTDILFKQKTNPGSLCTSFTKRIVIMNLEGKPIREDCIEDENILSSPTLTPLIYRSDLIMEIDNTSYYLLDSK